MCTDIVSEIIITLIITITVALLMIDLVIITCMIRKMILVNKQILRRLECIERQPVRKKIKKNKKGGIIL